MKKIISYFLLSVLLMFSFGIFAGSQLDNIRLYTAKGDYFTIYDDPQVKNIIGIFPKKEIGSIPHSAEFMGISANDRDGYKFLVSRAYGYNIIGYAKISDLTQIPLPTVKGELFQVLLDNYNSLQRIEFGGIFAFLTSQRSLTPPTLDIVVKKIFIMADIVEKQAYAKDMYALWKECNPDAEHLTINFVKEYPSRDEKVILKIQDGVIIQ